MVLPSKKSKRAGGAAVEFAVVAPLFFLLVIGSIQLFRFASVSNSVEGAVFEGVRKGILADTTDQQVRDAVNRSLASSGLSGHTVTITRNDVNGANEISIQVQLNMAANGFLVPSQGSSWTINRTCTICCE